MASRSGTGSPRSTRTVVESISGTNAVSSTEVAGKLLLMGS